MLLQARMVVFILLTVAVPLALARCPRQRRWIVASYRLLSFMLPCEGVLTQPHLRMLPAHAPWYACLVDVVRVMLGECAGMATPAHGPDLMSSNLSSVFCMHAWHSSGYHPALPHTS